MSAVCTLFQVKVKAIVGFLLWHNSILECPNYFTTETVIKLINSGTLEPGHPQFLSD